MVSSQAMGTVLPSSLSFLPPQRVGSRLSPTPEDISTAVTELLHRRASSIMVGFGLNIDSEAMQHDLYLVSSVMRVAPPPTESQVCHLAVLAWYELIGYFKNIFNLSRRLQPGALTAMYTNGWLYISTSVRAKGEPRSWINAVPDIPERDLVVCAIQDSGINPATIHRTRANCGEMLVLFQWTRFNPPLTFQNLVNDGALFVTIGQERADGELVLAVKAPCTAEVGGCLEVLDSLQLKYVTACFEPDLNECQVTLSEHRQQSIF
ncbi:hypothetical protein F4777DRAFT_516683 [Nemania sp. FL0916]|nr:hypothetical protein F4777DRAFT_516683 [Nemania sp. FL0916]